MTERQQDPATHRLHLYLSRHGETVWNTEHRMQGRGDSPLTEKGLSDAKKLASFLAAIPLTAAFCSPAGRARLTTEIALAGQPVPIIEEDRIQEMALGRYEGLSVREAYALDHENMEAFFHHPERYKANEGESFEAVYNRIKTFLDDLTSDPLKMLNRAGNVIPDGDDLHILVISHNITIKAMLTVMQNQSVERIREGPPIPQTTLIPVIYDPSAKTWLTKFHDDHIDLM